MDNEKYFNIKTCDDWMGFNNIINLIITNKSKGYGYIRYNNELWIKLCNTEKEEYNLKNIINDNINNIYIIEPLKKLIGNEEFLNIFSSYRHIDTNKIIKNYEYQKLDNYEKKEYIFNNIRFDDYCNLNIIDKKLYSKENIYKYFYLKYDENKIYNSAIKNYYKKDVVYYNLKYNEYLINNTFGENKYVILDTLNFTFTPVDNIILDKIITNNNVGGRSLHLTNNIDINIVDNILDTLISIDRKKEYKKIMYNLLVKHNGEEIIFNDYKFCYLAEWIKDIMYTLKGEKEYIYSNEYYNNKKVIKKLIESKKIKCVFISNFNTYRTIENQIENFRALGLKIMIIKNNYDIKDMYNENNYMKYLNDNKETICEYIVDKKKYNIGFVNDIFCMENMLLTNFLKWCCLE
jgi:hypothetical protein